MRVETISVKDFLVLSDATVSTDRPLTVVTGPNGSGKSSLLQALNLVKDAAGANAVASLAALDREWAKAG